MPEEDFWFACDDPLELLKALHPPRTLGSVQPQTRASRAYLIACARRQWHRLPTAARVLVALAELFAADPRKADRLRSAVGHIAASLAQSPGDPEDFLTASAELAEANIPDEFSLALNRSDESAPLTSEPAAWGAFKWLLQLPFESNTPSYHWVSREHHSLDLLREVYGNPYRAVAFEEAWRTGAAMGMARQMYATGDFTAMPFLADALQEAGCENPDILKHCRAPVEHVRGCWVLDQLLRLR
jgi:hypothetical protein